MAIRSSNDYEVLDVISTKGKQKCVRLLQARLLQPLHNGNDIVCVKTFTSPKYSMVREALNEAQTLLEASLQHPSICQMYDCYTEVQPDRAYSFGIVMEYFERGDLEDHIQSRKYHCERWTESCLLSLYEQLVSALEVLQTRKICHRDIKPQNIFVATDTLVKIGDFGVSRKEVFEDSSERTLVGTPIYFSPLCAKAFFSGDIYKDGGVRHNMYKSDVFSLGLTFLRMATLKNVRGLNAGDQAAIDLRIAQLAYSPQMQLLLRTMLTIEERDRPDFIQLSQYLRTVNRFKLQRPLPLEYETEEIEDLCDQTSASIRRLEAEIVEFQAVAVRPALIKSTHSTEKRGNTLVSYAAVSTAGIDISKYEAEPQLLESETDPDDYGSVQGCQSLPVPVFTTTNNPRLEGKQAIKSCCVGNILGSIKTYLAEVIA